MSILNNLLSLKYESQLILHFFYLATQIAFNQYEKTTLM